MNQKLQQQFMELYTFLDTARNYLNTIDRHKKIAKQYEDNYAEMKKKKHSIIGKNLSAIGICFVVALAGLTTAVEGIANADTTFETMDLYISDSIPFFCGIGLFGICLALMVILPLILTVIYTGKNKKLEAKANAYWKENGPKVKEYQDSAIRLKAEYDEFATKYIHLLDFLPVQYHNIDAITHMFQIVDAGRADSLKETINLYEQERRWEELRSEAEYHRNMQMLRIQELQEQQKKTNKLLNEIETLELFNYIDKH